MESPPSGWSLIPSMSNVNLLILCFFNENRHFNVFSHIGQIYRHVTTEKHCRQSELTAPLLFVISGPWNIPGCYMNANLSWNLTSSCQLMCWPLHNSDILTAFTHLCCFKYRLTEWYHVAADLKIVPVVTGCHSGCCLAHDYICNGILL